MAISTESQQIITIEDLTVCENPDAYILQHPEYNTGIITPLFTPIRFSGTCHILTNKNREWLFRVTSRSNVVNLKNALLITATDLIKINVYAGSKVISLNSQEEDKPEIGQVFLNLNENSESPEFISPFYTKSFRLDNSFEISDEIKQYIGTHT